MKVKIIKLIRKTCTNKPLAVKTIKKFLKKFSTNHKAKMINWITSK